MSKSTDNFDMLDWISCGIDTILLPFIWGSVMGQVMEPITPLLFILIALAGGIIAFIGPVQRLSKTGRRGA